MDNTEMMFVCEELRACRVCLATDVKLLVLYPGPLAETYEQLTGTPVLPTDGLPQHLCSFCAALLKKSAAFIKKCRDTQAFLQQSFKPLQPFGNVLNKVEITMSLIRNLDKGCFKLPYITTNTQMLSLPEDVIDGNFYQYEVPIKIEIETDHEIGEHKLDCVLNEPVDDFYDSMLDEKPIEHAEIKKEIFTDVNIIKTDPISVSSEAVSNKRKYVKGSPDKEVEEIKKYVIKCKEETDDHYKQLFYDYVLHKYFNKTKDTTTDDCDIFVSDAGATIKTVGDLKSVIKNANVPNNAEVTKLLCEFIKDKYVTKKAAGEERKVVDVVRLKVKKIKNKKKGKTEEELEEFTKTYNFDIIKMNKREQILELERARKRTLQYQRSKFTCNDCFRGFKSETVFNSHMTRAHDPSIGSHVCDVCRHRFPKATDLKKHVQKHATKLVCRQCQQVYNSFSLAREHYKSHAGVSYACEHCGATFRKYGSRVNHIRIHHGTTTCDICYEGFQGVQGLTQHKTKAHGKTYPCASCGVHFDNAGANRRHLGAAGGACDPTIRACAKCGELCPSDEQFNSHVASLHDKTKGRYVERVSRVRRCCKCPRLEGGTDGKGECNVPSSEHSVPVGDSCPCGDGEGACVCPRGSERSCMRVDCSNLTNEADAFSRQNWAHKGCCKEKAVLTKSQVMCEMCATIFPTEAALTLHQRVHTGEKPFQCSECPSRFRTKFLLQMHTRTHTGDRPVKCQLCPKAFKTRAAYYRHQLVHTKERRHRCEVCNKMFQTSTCVKVHVKTVHMKIPQPPRERSRKRKAE